MNQVANDGPVNVTIYYISPGFNEIDTFSTKEE